MSVRLQKNFSKICCSLQPFCLSLQQTFDAETKTTRNNETTAIAAHGPAASSPLGAGHRPTSHAFALYRASPVLRRVAATGQRQAGCAGLWWHRHLPGAAQRHHPVDGQARRPQPRQRCPPVGSPHSRGPLCRELCPGRLAAAARARPQLAVLSAFRRAAHHCPRRPRCQLSPRAKP